MTNVLETTEGKLEEETKAKVGLEATARGLRQEVERLQEGAGAIIRQGQELRKRKAEIGALVAVQKQREKRLHDLTARRSSALETLDQVRESRFAARQEIAMNLSIVLAPSIEIKVVRAGQFEAFARAIADALKGTGIKYNDLAPAIAAKISPRELLEAVDAVDPSILMEAVGISRERATRILAALLQVDIAELATVNVEDEVQFALLDGKKYKPFNELSTGQRCTVILPLILQHAERVIVLDQPEDHIDNAFIAATLIRSLLNRGMKSQVILTTHNANIPVLGNANRVIQLGSDGRRGFCLVEDELTKPKVVDAISLVMEGGVAAFKRRAEFYEAGETP